MKTWKRVVLVMAGLLNGQEAWADAVALPTMGLGAGAFREGADKSVGFVTDLFLGVDVRAQDPVPLYPAFVARAHVLLGGTSRLEPRAYLVAHTSSWSSFLSGREDAAVGLGVGPSIPLSSDTPARITLGLFLHATAANVLSLELGVRSLSGPLDLSATVQLDVGLGLLVLARTLGDT